MVNEKILRELIESDEDAKWREILNEMLKVMSEPISTDKRTELVNDMAIDLLFASIILGTVFPMSKILEYGWERSFFEKWSFKYV